MKTLIGTLLLASVWFGASEVSAEIPGYSSTDNTGLNKKERIDAVETYLSNLTQSLSKMEQKLDENAKKLADLDRVVSALKANEAKKVDSKLGEAKQPTPSNPSGKPEPSELEKLKADVLALKNQDIEKLKVNLEELSDTVKAIQVNLKK